MTISRGLDLLQVEANKKQKSTILELRGEERLLSNLNHVQPRRAATDSNGAP